MQTYGHGTQTFCMDSGQFYRQNIGPTPDGSWTLARNLLSSKGIIYCYHITDYDLIFCLTNSEENKSA